MIDNGARTHDPPFVESYVIPSRRLLPLEHGDGSQLSSDQSFFIPSLENFVRKFKTSGKFRYGSLGQIKTLITVKTTFAPIVMTHGQKICLNNTSVIFDFEVIWSLFSRPSHDLDLYLSPLTYFILFEALSLKFEVFA